MRFCIGCLISIEAHKPFVVLCVERIHCVQPMKGKETGGDVRYYCGRERNGVQNIVRNAKHPSAKDGRRNDHPSHLLNRNKISLRLHRCVEKSPIATRYSSRRNSSTRSSASMKAYG